MQLSYTNSDELVKDDSNKILNEEEIELEEQKGSQSQNYSSLIDRRSVRLRKEYLNITIDLVVINNQLLEAQFPVLLAPNKKKIFGEQQPFLMISLFWKDQNNTVSKK